MDVKVQRTFQITESEKQWLFSVYDKLKKKKNT